MYESDGKFVGSSASEINVFQATVHLGRAPFNAGYEWFNRTKNAIIPDVTITEQEPYTGGCVSIFKKWG